MMYKISYLSATIYFVAGNFGHLNNRTKDKEVNNNGQ